MSACTDSEPFDWQLFQSCLEQPGGGDWPRFVARFARRIRESLSCAIGHIGPDIPAAEPEDLHQDLYCRLLRRRRSFRGGSEGEVWSYLRQLCFSMVRDHRRRQLAGKRRPEWACRDRFSEVDGLPSDDPGPEEILLRRERWSDFLARCVALAPVSQRPLVRRLVPLAYVEGLTSGEISRRLGGRPDAKQVDNLLHRLKIRLAAEGIELPRRCGFRSPDQEEAPC